MVVVGGGVIKIPFWSSILCMYEPKVKDKSKEKTLKNKNLRRKVKVLAEKLQTEQLDLVFANTKLRVTRYILYALLQD